MCVCPRVSRVGECWCKNRNERGRGWVGVGDCFGESTLPTQGADPLGTKLKTRTRSTYKSCPRGGAAVQRRCSGARLACRTKFIQNGRPANKATASTVMYASHSWQITHVRVAIATLRETLFLTALINPQTNGVSRHLPRIFLKGCQAAATQPQRRSATAP